MRFVIEEAPAAALTMGLLVWLAWWSLLLIPFGLWVRWSLGLAVAYVAWIVTVLFVVGISYGAFP